MKDAALERFARQMATAIEAGRITRAGANSVLGQVVLDHAGRGDVVGPWTRERNQRRISRALAGEEHEAC